MRFSGFFRAVSGLRARLFQGVLVCGVMVALTSCDTSAVQQPTPPALTPTVAATPTLPATPKVVFQADWSHGAGIWKLPPHWTIKNGALVSDGYETDNVPVPYTVTATNYRILMTARMVGVTSVQTSCNNYFGIVAEDGSGARMFTAESACFGPLPYHGDSRLLDATNTGKVWEMIIGSNARTYRVDVYGRNAIYFPGSAGSMGGITNPQPNSPAHLFIEGSQVKVVITRFVVMTI